MRWIAGASVVLIACGCGSQEPPRRAKPTAEQQVRAALERYDAGWRTFGTDTICGALSERLSRAFAAGDGTPCDVDIEDAYAYVPESTRMVGTRVASVEVRGDRATVTLPREPTG